MKITSVAVPTTEKTPAAAASIKADDSAMWSLMGLVRDIREEIQNIEKSVREVTQQGALIDLAARTREVHASLADAAQIFDGNKARIRQLFPELRSLLKSNPELYDRVGDEVTEIENEWERVCHNWPAANDPVDEVLMRLKRVQTCIDEAVFHGGLVTIPERANQHLAALRSGQALDFHATFNDELPKPEDRVKLLEYLSGHPVDIHGVVDVQSGMIYRASQKTWRRLVSYGIIALFLVLGLFAIYIYQWFVSKELPHIRDFLGGALPKGYLFVVLGSLAHILINAVKQSRAQAVASLRALDDWLLWIHVKELSIVVSIISLWIGIIGLASFQPDVAPGNAFFVGYSIDSFVDLFLERFTGIAAAKTEAMTVQWAKASQ